MTWLLAHMWIALTAAAFAGLVLGWSVRGGLLVSKLRRAQVDRDIARVELTEAREEVERLFAAQRSQPAAADAGLQRQLAQLTEELQRKAEEIERFKSGAPDTSPAPEVDDKLVWQKKHLETRVAYLEAELERVSAEAASAGAEPPAEMSKLTWGADYLRQRVRALEDALISRSAMALTAAKPAAGEQDAVEELASLRWRNKALEKRLAYFEGDDPAVTNGADHQPDGHQPAETRHVSEAILDHLSQVDAEAEAAETGEAEVSPLRPPALASPEGGQADDLTQIGGIGPKIQELLNKLGVYHHSQIASWTPENVAWIDQYLNFGGRIVREGWVGQAASLVAEVADA